MPVAGSEKKTLNWKSVVFQTIMFGGLVATGLSTVAFVASFNPAIDLFSHFRWQYAVLLGITALIAWRGKRPKYVTTFFIAAILNATVVVSLWYPANVPPLAQAHSTLSILDMNVYYGNRHYSSVAAEIGKYSADIVVIEELTSEMLAALQPSLKAFPYRVVNVENPCWGIGIFSRHKLVNCSENPLAMPQSNVISADVELDTGNVTLEAIHTAPRFSHVAVDTDRLLIERLKKLNRELSTPIILVGDFNATPWSDLFRNLSGTANFIDSEQGCGPALSWPVGIPILALPIDHCLYDRKWRTGQRRLGNAMGSDHLPLFIQLEIPH